MLPNASLFKQKQRAIKKKKEKKTEAVITLLVKRIQCSVEHILEHKLDMREQEPCPP